LEGEREKKGRKKAKKRGKWGGFALSNNNFSRLFAPEGEEKKERGKELKEEEKEKGKEKNIRIPTNFLRSGAAKEGEKGRKLGWRGERTKTPSPPVAMA